MLAGIKLTEQPCVSVDLQRHLPSKSSTTTSSVIDAAECYELMRDEPDSVFGDEDTTLTETPAASARKQPRLTSVEDMFATSPPGATQEILTPFFGVFTPGEKPPKDVRLQILDILRCDNNGFIDLHLSDGEWYSVVKVSATHKDYFL